MVHIKKEKEINENAYPMGGVWPISASTCKYLPITFPEDMDTSISDNTIKIDDPLFLV